MFATAEKTKRKSLTPKNSGDRYLVRECADTTTLEDILNAAPRSWEIAILQRINGEWLVVFDIR